MVASCMYPLRDNGFEISTSSVAVRKARRFVLELLINRCPSSPHLLALADEYGASPEPRFLSKSPEMKSGEEVLAPREKLCILCGRCARACLISGGAAIGLAGRGRARKATGPFFREPEACVGCLACASVCPTGAIWGEENKGFRRIWGREFELAPCTSCGRKFATEAQIRIGGLLERLCPDCRRLKTASGLKDALCCSAIR